jgi:transposase
MNEKKRRKWTAGEKLRIVLTCMQPGVEVSEVCRREGINPTMYYTWKKKLLSSASQVFEEKAKQRDAQQERTGRELARMKDVIAEITAENLELKKRFRARGPRQDAAGVAGAGPRGGGAGQAAERLGGGPDAFGVGCEPHDVLPLAADGGPARRCRKRRRWCGNMR